jgi:hypothetical protein
MDPLKTFGIVVTVLLLAAAGHASFRGPGLAIGVLIGIALAFSVVKLLRMPNINQDRAFDPARADDLEQDPASPIKVKTVAVPPTVASEL